MSWLKDIWNWILDLVGLGGPEFDDFADTTQPFVGYGLVNNWFEQDPKKYMNKCVEAGVECMAFEFFEWGPTKFEQVDDLLERFKEYVDLAKKKKVLLYVTILNCNVGSGKYGDPRIPSNHYTDQIIQAANKLAEWMKDNPNILVTPCGEGGAQSNMNTHDRTIQNYCKQIMPLTQMVNNWGSRPNSTDGMRFLCQHPSGVAAAQNSKSYVMSDHGLFIAELNGGGLYGTCNYDITKNCAVGLKARNKTFIYYHFNANGSIDDVALKALGDAQK